MAKKNADKVAKKTRLTPSVKQSETVRERSTKGQNIKTPKRRIRGTARAAAKPFAIVWSTVKKIARPFRFLLWPFKTRPVRFVGRIIGKILFLGYFRDSWRELKNVTWPNRKETRQLTMAVFSFAIVFGLMVTVIDYGLDKVFKNLLLK